MKKVFALFISSCLVVSSWSDSRSLRPKITLDSGAIKPSKVPLCDQSVLLGYSSAQANISFDFYRYAPVEDGGFRLIDKQYRFNFNRSIVSERNCILTGDRPIFKITTSTGSGVYGHAKDRCFPIFGREDEEKAQTRPELGTLQLGVPDGSDVEWFHDLPDPQTLFRPGYTTHDLSSSKGDWSAQVTILPALDFNGFICRVEFDKPTPLVWSYGGIHWNPGVVSGKNKVSLSKNYAELTDSELPNLQVFVGWNAKGKGKSETMADGKGVKFESSSSKKVYYIFSAWGVNRYDKSMAQAMMSRLDSPNTAGWQKKADELKKSWFDCYIARALNPKKNLTQLQKDPKKEFSRAKKYWDDRRLGFQVKTPDPYFNAAINFQAAASEYHHFGPGLVLSSSTWMMYSHISVGWYGRLWAGDVDSLKDYLYLFAAMQNEEGYINWVSPSLAAYSAENNGPYWVDQIWWVYQWGRDRQFLVDLWPAVQKAVAREQKVNDPDGDGLFGSSYEYWNCDSNGKGPKAATPTATAWNMYDKVAKMATIVGDTNMATAYTQQAEKIKTAAMKELWDDDLGLFTSIGANEIKRGHPQTWEQYLPLINGLLPPEKARRGLRWLDAHYGFEPQENVRLLMSCDWWPIRWSVHWVPVGDSLLAATAGLKCGDADLWWPYVHTVAASSFRSDGPSIRFGISNTGSGGSEIEDVDADDPHSQMAVRGLFGVTPNFPEDRIYVAPGFPSAWKEASLKTPYVSIQYTRKGSNCTLRIETPLPTVKVVRGRIDLPEQTTKKEKISVVSYTLPKAAPVPPLPPKAPQVMTDKNPPKSLPQLSAKDERQQIPLDLSAAYNTRLRKLCTEIRFTSDCGGDTTIHTWWHTVVGYTGDGSEKIDASDGTQFLLKGRSASANNLLALSSWKHNDTCPLPSVAHISINKKLKSVRLLMQNYVSPIKNYIPNGEVVLHYADGTSETTQLIPPYNLDCYFQAFSREGESIPLGGLEESEGWSPCYKERDDAQAQMLPIPCDSSRTLKEIEIRATVSEGVLGITAITLIPAK